MIKLKQFPIVRSFLVSYVLILFIPLITGFISYSVSFNSLKSSSVEASTMLLNQSKDILDRRMEEVESITRKLAMDQDLNVLLNEKVDSDNYNVYALWKSWRNASAYSPTNNFLDDFYIYLNNYNAVFTPSGVYVRPDDYYDLYHYTVLDRTQWKADILNKVHNRETLPARIFDRNGNATSVISYLQSLPIDSYNRSLGTIVILIDETKIAQMMERVSNQYGGWATIHDKDGKLVAQSGTGEKKDGMLLISSKSDYNGWVYTVGLPKKTVFQKTYLIANITWTITGSTLLVGLLAALYLAYRSSLPVNRLQGSVSSLTANNKFLEDELKRQLPLLEDSFIRRLIKGEFSSTQEMRAVQHTLSDTGLRGEFGYVGIIRINGYGGLVSKEIFDELNAAKLIVIKILQEVSGSQIKTTDLDSDKIIFLMTFPKKPDASVCDQIGVMVDHLRDYANAEYRIQITASIGNVFHALADVSRSFDEARQALDHAVLREEQRTLWYEHVEKGSTTYYYPIDLELRLMNAVKIGEGDEVNRIFEQLYERNFVERHLSAEMVQQLFGEMKGTLFKLLQQSPFTEAAVTAGLKERVEHLQPAGGLDRFREDIRSVLKLFFNQVLKKKRDEDGEVVDRVLSFLGTHYSDPDINLYRISESVGLPEKTISQLFSEQTGEYLSDYLEKIRIAKATDLLFQSGQTIDEISHNVGYNSSHAFRRAFKRVSGVSPSLYRKVVH